MSRLAIFKLNCCSREIVFGRFRGDDMFPHSIAKCRYGCVAKKGLRGRTERAWLTFVRYEFDDTISRELLRTWKYPDKSGDLWHKYNREWLRRKEAAEQGAPGKANKKAKAKL